MPRHDNMIISQFIDFSGNLTSFRKKLFLWKYICPQKVLDRFDIVTNKIKKRKRLNLLITGTPRIRILTFMNNILQPLATNYKWRYNWTKSQSILLFKRKVHLKYNLDEF